MPVARPHGARRRRPGAAGRGRRARRAGSRSSCGKGNNGGDGLVAARLLREAGREVDVLAARRRPRSCAATRRRTSSACPASRRGRSRPRRWTAPRASVDALLGTGFSGEPARADQGRDRGDERARAPAVVAADVPSGVDASTGEVAGRRRAGRARPRPSIAPSPGCGSRPARRTPARCAWSRSASRRARPRRPTSGLIGRRVLGAVPPRAAGSTKFTRGRRADRAAARRASPARRRMASESAQRAGAGYVTACVPALAQLRSSSCACSRR